MKLRTILPLDAVRKGLCRTKSKSCIFFLEVEPLVFGIRVFNLFVIFYKKARLWTGHFNSILEKDSPNLISGTAGFEKKPSISS